MYAIATLVLNSLDSGVSDSSSRPGSTERNITTTRNGLNDFDWIFSKEIGYLELYELSESLSYLSQRELVALIKKSSTQPPSTRIYTIQEILIEFLVQISPENAVSCLTEFAEHRKRALLPVVFTSWSATNIKSALSAAAELPLTDRKFVIKNIIAVHSDLTYEDLSTLATSLRLNSELVAWSQEFEMYEVLDQEPARALDLLANDEIDDVEQVDSFLQVVEKWFEYEGFDIIPQIESASLDEGLWTKLFEYIVDQDRLAALDFLKGDVERTTRTGLGYRLISSWVEEDVEAAFQALQNLPRSRFRSSMFTTLVIEWGRKDPNTVLDRLMEIPRKHRSDAISTVANELAKDNPKSTLDRILSTSAIPGTNVNLAIPDFVKTWAADAPKRALEWVQTYTPENSNERIELFRAVLPQYALVEPTRAMTVAVEEYRSDQIGRSLESSVIFSLLSADRVDTAIELLDQVRDEIRGSETINVGAELAKKGRMDDVLALGTSVSSEEKLNYFYWVAARMTDYDQASDILELISRIPTVELQSDVVERIFSQRYGLSAFTAKQIETLKSYISK